MNKIVAHPDLLWKALKSSQFYYSEFKIELFGSRKCPQLLTWSLQEAKPEVPHFSREIIFVLLIALQRARYKACFQASITLST